MTFTVKLEQADGTPAEPPTIQSTVTVSARRVKGTNA